MFNYEFLKKEHTIAGLVLNRWMVASCSSGIHLCIGMHRFFRILASLSKALGVTAPIAAPEGMSYIARVFSSSYDWPSLWSA
jgi:hypothetical protein